MTDFTWQELKALREWQVDNTPMDAGGDPYNTADWRWNRWLLALSRGLLG